MNEKAHALLSASGSKRWLTCIPSALLEQEFEEEKSAYGASEHMSYHIMGENPV